MTRSLFRAYSKGESMPDRIVSQMNHDLNENNKNFMFVTLFVGILDLTSGLLRYCNAGHEAPILIHQGAVNDFIGDDEQSDDLTMMAIRQ